MSKFLKKWKEQGLCVFCEGTGLTKQHVWANQLNKIIPKVNPKITFNQFFLNRVEDQLHIRPEIVQRNGDAGTLQIRKVCEKCNNGWIKKIENDAISDYIRPLILNQSIDLDEQAQTKIAAWLTIVTMMAEYTAADQMVISKKERQDLMNSMKPLPNWQIVIGKYSSDKDLTNLYSHRSSRMAEKRKPDIAIANVQMTTNILGSFFFIAYCTNGEFPEARTINVENVYNSLGRRRPVLQIWPIKYSNLNIGTLLSSQNSDIIKTSSDLFSHYYFPTPE